MTATVVWTTEGAVDQFGTVTFGSTDTPAAGAQFSLVWPNQFDSDWPYGVEIFPQNEVTAALGPWYPVNMTINGADIACTGTPDASQPDGTYVLCVDARQ